ncbi:MAG: 5-(carboxyamino)imidazole ribonucleotide synthase [Dehalococcoidia bacterium]|nr:5-(carboxyamino)imidazole ribonucleotide synthase [Dehalococcoidia bacterium]
MSEAAAIPLDARAPVGMVGGGQLARMTYQAGIALGLTLPVLAEHPDDSAALSGAATSIGSPGSLEALRAFARECQVLTFDHELVPPAHLAALEAEGVVLRPGARAMRFAQDKAHQREVLGALGIPVPFNRRVASVDELAMFGDELGWPCVVKAITGGYDGRGVWIFDDPRQASELFASGREFLAEAFVPIDREIAVLVARRPGGETVLYPAVETVQVDGMFRESVAPAPMANDLRVQVGELAQRIAEATDATGILAIEFFLAEGRVVLNEVATRPHNSGHYTIEGAVTSQFENHLRAVLDWPLGETWLYAPAVVTVNVVGVSETDPRANLRKALAVPGVHVHLYGKGPRPGRKLGHVTALGDDPGEARERAVRAARLITGEETGGLP